MAPPRLLLILAAASAAACGDSTPAKPAARPGEKPGETRAAPAKPAEGEGGGMDLASIRKKMEEARAAAAAAPPAAAPASKRPLAPPPPEAGAPGPGAGAPPAGAKPPGARVPASPAEITDDEVLASWSEDERDALKEMSPEERAKEMAKRRLEIFAQRGGVLAAEAPKPGDPPAAPQGGSRGPARPEVKRESAPVEFREILNDLASKDPEERARGAENAKSYPDKEAVAKYVLDVLPDPDPDVRAIIAATLGALRYEQAVAPLAALVDKPGEKDPVRMAAIKALHDIGGEKGIAALQKIVSEAGDPSDHATALAMLVTFRDAALVKDLLKPCLVDISADTRQQAVIAIREFSLREYEKDLLPLLDDASEQVVKDVMRTFGAFGTRAAVGPIVKILLKPDPEADSPEDIQTTANEALEKITGNKMGYDTSLSDEKIQAALDAWKTWWSKNRDKWK